MLLKVLVDAAMYVSSWTCALSITPTLGRRVAVLSKPFRASMRDRPCAGDQKIGLGRPSQRRTATPSLGRRRHTRFPYDSSVTMR